MKKKFNSVISVLLAMLVIVSSALCGIAADEADADVIESTSVIESTEAITENSTSESNVEETTTKTSTEESTTEAASEETTTEPSTEEPTTEPSTEETTEPSIEETTEPDVPEIIVPEKVVVTSVESTKNGVVIKWNDVLSFLDEDSSKANGYFVYRKTEGTGWKKISDVKNALEYTDGKVQYGSTYYYTVKAYYYTLDSELINGPYNKDGYKIEVSNVTKPVLYRTELYGSKYVQITWGKTTGATKYALYRATAPDGKYSKIYVGTSRKYVDRNVSPGNTYYYKLKAYTDSKGSAASEYISFKMLPAVPQFNKNVTVNATAVKLKWKASQGADGYVLYRKAKNTVSWKRIKTIRSGNTLTYTNKGLEAGKTYYYLIKAYYIDVDGNNYTGNSTIVVRTLSAPATVKVSTSKTTHVNTIKWSKVSGAHGYQIYVKVKGTSWTLLDTTDSATRAYYHTATMNTDYYYKIRAFYGTHEVSYGPYSDYKKLTVNYLPEFTYKLPSDPISKPTYIKMNIKNTGNKTMRIYSTDAVQVRLSEVRNIEIYLKMKSSTNGKYVEYIDIPAGKSANIYLYMQENAFGYSPEDFIGFMFIYNNGVYVATLSQYYGSQVIYYGQKS